MSTKKITLNELRNLVKQVIKEEFQPPTKIFNTDIISQQQAINYLQTELTPLAPFVKVSSGALGNETIMLLVSFEPKENWSYGYVENSNYFRMRIEDNGMLEVFVATFYKKGTNASSAGYDNRLKIKFRKTTVKSLEEAKKKIADYINKIKEYYNNPESISEETEMIDEERLTLDLVRDEVKNKKNLVSSHLFAEWIGEQLYIVVSYNRKNTIFIWKDGKWYENKDSYFYNGDEVENSKKHKKASRPTFDTHLKTAKEMQEMVEDAMKKAGIKELSHSEVFPGTKN